MKNVEIAIIAPYKELASLAFDVCNDLHEDIIIKTGDLAEGVLVAEQLAKEGIKIIISRGGTAKAIRVSSNIPVVEIMISGFDIIRAVSKAKEKGNRIGVVGFKNIIYGSSSLSEIMEVSIQEFKIESLSDAENAVKQAASQNINVIVGDAVATRMAHQYGLKSVLITSGKESISVAIKDAHEILRLHRKEQSRLEQLRAILEFTYEGIIAVDQQGYITLMNPEAEKLLQLNRDKVLGKLASYIMPGIPFQEALNSGVICKGNISNINNKSLAHNVVPLLIDNQTVGAVATVQDIKRIQEIEEKARKANNTKGLFATYRLSDIVTTSNIMIETIERAKKFARVDSTVLLTGETGTGKEMFAQGIHNFSNRNDGPFVAINCATLTESILASELFGYEEGAFTGAKKGGKKGLFELAHGGTIFLDEIAEISTSMQARLLRVLQEKEVMRVGGSKIIPINARIIAATCRNLRDLINDSKFRKDLYHRISVLVISIPPLRKRVDDISVLIRVLCRDLSKKLGFDSPNFDNKALDMLKSYSWPGNVRELKNVLEQIIVLRHNKEVTRKDVLDILENMDPGISQDRTANFLGENGFSSVNSLSDIENQAIINALELSKTKKEAARKLGISTTTLWRRTKVMQNENIISK